MDNYKKEEQIIDKTQEPKYRNITHWLSVTFAILDNIFVILIHVLNFYLIAILKLDSSRFKSA